MGDDIHFYFDPVCPFAWLTSKWVDRVVAQRDYEVDWRFISLRVLNKNVDYDTHFPPDYLEGHTLGLRLLRVCASARATHGREVVGPLYKAITSNIFDVAPSEQSPLASDRVSPETLRPIVEAAGVPGHHAEALDDDRWDEEVAAESEAALARTGRDVGTPIIHYEPPDGVAFFGPVISRVPNDADALVLWDHVLGLAAFPGFAELKRSLRERPQLRALGVDPDQAGIEEDWHGGSRRPKK